MFFFTVTPTSSQFVSISVHGPRAEEPLKDEQVTITCLLVGFGLKNFSIIWTVNGINQHVNFHTKQPMSHSNGTETLQSFLNISTKDWDAFKEVSCEGKHICSIQGYKDQIRKNRGSVMFNLYIICVIHFQKSRPNMMILSVCQYFFSNNYLILRKYL